MVPTNSAWGAVWFCAFLSVVALIGGVAEHISGTNGFWWKPAFYGFLPMCFVFLAFTMSAMQREISDLRLRLETSQPTPEQPTQR
jgi:hypothetical protein